MSDEVFYLRPYTPDDPPSSEMAIEGLPFTNANLAVLGGHIVPEETR